MKNHELRAKALVAQVLSDEGTRAYIKALGAVLQRIPVNECLYERAVHAFRSGDKTGTVEFLYRAAVASCQEMRCPIPCDELWIRWISPFEDGDTVLWTRLADAFATKFPESAAVMLLRAYVEHEKQNNDAAIQYLAECIHKDNAYWEASYQLAYIYEEAKNWSAARRCYEQSLTHALETKKADIYLDLGVCCGKLKDNAAEEQAYRKCIELNPDNELGWNNLGYTLMMAGKCEESVPVLKEGVERSTGDSIPHKNLVKALEKLGRYSEAIAFLEDCKKQGRIVAFADKTIARLQARRADTVPLEETLEALIEQMIKRGHRLFERQLRIYDSGIYGRQLVIPGIGRIDLLVEDTETHDLIVIELKRDETADEVVGQTGR